MSMQGSEVAGALATIRKGKKGKPPPAAKAGELDLKIPASLDRSGELKGDLIDAVKEATSKTEARAPRSPRRAKAAKSEREKERSRVRVEKLKAKQGGATRKMPLEGKAALRAIADEAVKNGHPIKRAEKKADKPRTTIGSVATAAMVSGCTNEEALERVKKVFPGCASNLQCMNWYRNRARRDGLLKEKKEKAAAARRPPAKRTA